MVDANAAESLAGLVLDTGWKVIDRIEKPPHATGGYFSVCYRVEKDGRVCFLKAYNFSSFFELARHGGRPMKVVDVLGEMLDSYRYERSLSALCRDKHVTKVSFVVDSGEQAVPGHVISVVPYLIFDLADGDVRTLLAFSGRLETAWKLESLHSVAVGLKQLHAIDVSHQDLKPSNVLLYASVTKIGDLGRSICLALDPPAPLRDEDFTGEYTYAPPEVLFESCDRDWRARTFATDLYLFGSLVVFYFSGLTMTALLSKHLHPDASWERHRGSYADVRDYVLNAFALALDEFASCVQGDELRNELRTMVSQLCHPIPELRGHPKGLASPVARHDLERYVSRLDLLHRRARAALLK